MSTKCQFTGEIGANLPKALTIRVVTIDQSTGIAEMEKDINFRDPSDKLWLQSHSFWCYHNGRTVTTFRI